MSYQSWRVYRSSEFFRNYTRSFSLTIFIITYLLTTLHVKSAYASDSTITVHILPHSHCDPGWLQTYQGYYRSSVSAILTNVVTELSKDSSRRFIWAEVSFFRLWWEEQSPAVKQQLIELINNGQFEFVGAGWVQNDEATVNFDHVIEQITEGHEYLLKNFNIRPRIAWQVDPFGHSSLTPSLFAKIGYEALAINRIHFSLKELYKKSKSLEFVWRASPTYGRDEEMFTHVLHTHYAAPIGYDWEEGGSVPLVNGNNVATYGPRWVDMIKGRAKAYRTTHVLIPWGDDFKFQRAEWQFQNMDILMKYINERKDQYNMEMRYTTLSEYFKLLGDYLTKNSDIKFPVYFGDFYPYADNEDSYWTGYYTTRPTLKAMCRKVPSVLRSAEMVYSLARSKMENADIEWDDYFKKILDARWTSALVAHHDGITGTSKKFVVEDYMKQLNDAMNNGYTVLTELSKLLLQKDGASLEGIPKFESSPSFTTKFNVESDKTYALVYHNSLGWQRQQLVSVRVNSPNVQVTDMYGTEVEVQISPIWDTDQNGFKPDTSSDSYELFFEIKLPAMGMSTYFLSGAAKKASEASYVVYSDVGRFSNYLKRLTGSDPISIENSYLRIVVDSTGSVTSLLNKKTKQELKFSVKYMHYITTRSGAYIFRSDNSFARPFADGTPVVHVIKGSLVEEVHIIWGTTMMKLRLHITDSEELGSFIDFSHSIHNTRANSEVIVRYTTSLSDDAHDFYADNGLETRHRVVDPKKKKEASYVPMLSTAFLRDKEDQFTVLSRQVAGVTSDAKGSLEIMLHRSLNQDDGRGLGESVVDHSTTSIEHWVLFDGIENSEGKRRRLQMQLEHPPKLIYAPIKDLLTWQTTFETVFAPMHEPLPDNVHLLSFKARDGSSDDIVVRLLHLYEANSPSDYATPTEIAIDSLLRDFQVKQVRPVSITLNREGVEVIRPIYPSNTSNILQSLGVVPLEAFSPGDKQNTDEEGVFLSQAALEQMKKDKEQKGRKLLAIDSPIVNMNPLDIKSFLIQIETTLDRPLPPKLPVSDKPKKPKSQSSKPSVKTSDDLKTSTTKAPDVRQTITLYHFLQQSYVSNMEIRTMIVFTLIGVGLILLVYSRLSARRRSKVAKFKV